MKIELNDVEARVIGCLIEKEATTPDYYPLTVNALIAACNQKTNRFPVVEFDEETVTGALDSLRDKNLVYIFFGGSSRVAKYKHLLPKILDLAYPEIAVLCVLMLRGPQTPGEIKSRTSRLYSFSGIEQVEETLSALRGRDEPLVVDLGRQPGQKESRFAHLLSGDVDIPDASSFMSVSRPGSAKLDEMEKEIGELRNEIGELKEQFEEFRSRFE